MATFRMTAFWNIEHLCDSFVMVVWKYLSPLTLWVRITIIQGVLDTTLCDKVCQWLATGRGFTPVSSTNKTYSHDITETTVNHVDNIARETFSFNSILRDNQRSSNADIIVLMWPSDEFVSPLNSICQEYWYAYSSPPLILGDTISRELKLLQHINLTRVKRTFKYLVLAPLKAVLGKKWGIFIEDIP